MSGDLHRIFVYGTLMKGEGNHRLIESQECEGEGFIHGFNLYNLGFYPGIRPSRHPEHIVHGEVYLVDDRTLEQVNRLEGEGSLYILQYVDVTMADKVVTAGVYVYNYKCQKRSRIYTGFWKQQKIYIAYGSNMNNHQMLSVRCPTSRYLGVSSLDGYRLLFRTNIGGRVYATIEEDASYSVPIVLWAIDGDSEDELDRREGYHPNNPFICSYWVQRRNSVTGRESSESKGIAQWNRVFYLFLVLTENACCTRNIYTAFHPFFIQNKKRPIVKCRSLKEILLMCNHSHSIMII